MPPLGLYCYPVLMAADILLYKLVHNFILIYINGLYKSVERDRNNQCIVMVLIVSCSLAKAFGTSKRDLSFSLRRYKAKWAIIHMHECSDHGIQVQPCANTLVYKTQQNIEIWPFLIVLDFLNVRTTRKACKLFMSSLAQVLMLQAITSCVKHV